MSRSDDISARHRACRQDIPQPSGYENEEAIQLFASCSEVEVYGFVIFVHLDSVNLVRNYWLVSMSSNRASSRSSSTMWYKM